MLKLPGPLPESATVSATGILRMAPVLSLTLTMRFQVPAPEVAMPLRLPLDESVKPVGRPMVDSSVQR